MRPATFMGLGLALGLLLVPMIARSENGADAARAEALFAEGRRLMAAHDYGAACPKFADSQALDPAPGTALNLATCYERAGKLASAWAAFKTAQASAEGAGQRDRAAAAKKKVADLEPHVSRLTIAVPPSSRVPGLEVRCDEEPVRDAEWGVSVPRDGGGHDIQARAPGKRTWSSHVELKDRGQTLDVEVPLLEDAPAPVVEAPVAPPQQTTPEAQATPAPAESHVVDEPEHGSRIQRPIAVGLVGLGAAGIAFGVIAGLEARTNIENAREACGALSPACPADSDAFGLRNTAESWATASTIGFVAGGALAAGGAILFLTAPRGDRGPSVGLAPAAQGTGVSLRGAF
jgi:hypothetical protein